MSFCCKTARSFLLDAVDGFCLSEAAPVGNPEMLLDLDFTTTSQPSDLDAYSRASACAPITGSGGSGVEVTKFTSGQYAYTYDANFSHTSKLAMLVEPAATNQIVYSEFDASETGWSNQGGNFSTFDGGVGTAPDGTSTAIDVAVVSGVRGEMRTSSAFSVSAGVQHTISFFARSDDGSPPGVGISFDGTDYTPAQTGITALTSDWARYEFQATPGGSSTNLELQITGPNQSAQFWGVQVEANDVATSYIPTSGATASRVVTVATVTGATNKGFIDPAKGEIQGTMILDIAGSALWFRANATGLEDERWARVSSSTSRLYDGASSIEASISQTYTPTPGTEHTFAARWANDGSLSIGAKSYEVLMDGVSGGSDGTGSYTVGTANSDLEVGHSGGAAQITGRIATLKIYSVEQS